MRGEKKQRKETEMSSSSSSALSFFLGSHHLPLPRSSSHSRIARARTAVAFSGAENHGHEPESHHPQKGKKYITPMAISAATATRRESVAMMLLASVSLGIVYALLLPVPPMFMRSWGVAATEESPCSLTVSPSGLAFCDRLLGTGPEASKGQLIKAHYVGKLENRKVFDSSYQRGKPLTFCVGVGEVPVLFLPIRSSCLTWNSSARHEKAQILNQT